MAESPEKREAWLQERKEFVGASDIAAILGVSPWATALDVYLSKLPDTPVDSGMLEHQLVGLRFEKTIGEIWSEMTDRKIRRTGKTKRHDTHRRAGCTPDFLWAEPDVREGGGVLQIKNVGSYGAKHWKDGEIPEYYRLQIEHEMACTGKEWGAFAVLTHGNTLLHDQKPGYESLLMRPDPELGGALMRRAQDWYETHVEARKAPDPTWQDLDTLSWMFPQATENMVRELGENAVAAAELLEEAQAEMGKVEKAIKACKAVIQAEIGEAMFGRLPNDAGAFKWGNQTRQGTMSRSAIQALKGEDLERFLGALRQVQDVDDVLAVLTKESSFRVLRRMKGVPKGVDA